MKMNWDAFSSSFCCQRARKTRGLCCRSARTDFWTTFSTRPQSWCSTASTPTNSETTWQSSKPRQEKWWTSKSFLSSCWRTESLPTSNTPSRTFLRPENLEEGSNVHRSSPNGSMRLEFYNSWSKHTGASISGETAKFTALFWLRNWGRRPRSDASLRQKSLK